MSCCCLCSRDGSTWGPFCKENTGLKLDKLLIPGERIHQFSITPFTPLPHMDQNPITDHKIRRLQVLNLENLIRDLFLFCYGFCLFFCISYHWAVRQEGITTLGAWASLWEMQVPCRMGYLHVATWSPVAKGVVAPCISQPPTGRVAREKLWAYQVLLQALSALHPKLSGSINLSTARMR